MGGLLKIFISVHNDVVSYVNEVIQQNAQKI